MSLRIEKITDKGVIVYHYDLQGDLLAETNRAGTPIRDYVWRDAIPVAQINHHGDNDDDDDENDHNRGRGGKEKIAYLHTDHLNTPRFATDGRGRIIWRWTSDAFGDTFPAENFNFKKEIHEDFEAELHERDLLAHGVTINLRFPGQYFDKETGFHYNWHRYYDPRTGRYVTSDPIGLLGGLNTYAYVGGNPLKYTDPSGQFGTAGYVGEGVLVIGAVVTGSGFPYVGVPIMVVGGGLIVYSFWDDISEVLDWSNKMSEQQQKGQEKFDKLFPPKQPAPACSL